METLQMVKGTSVEDILRSLNVPVKYMKPDNKILHEDENGVAIRSPCKNKYWVVIRDDLSEDLRQKVLCHELGHIVLGHLTDPNFLSMPVKQREKEADEFASFVLPYIYRLAIERSI